VDNGKINEKAPAPHNVTLLAKRPKVFRFANRRKV